MKSVVRLTDQPDMTLDVTRGRKLTIQQQQQNIKNLFFSFYLYIFYNFITTKQDRKQSRQLIR